MPSLDATSQYLHEMESWLAPAFGTVLALVCLFWIAGYFAKRTRGR